MRFFSHKNSIKTGFFYLLPFLLFFFPQFVMADDTGGTFTPVPGDLSMQYLANIFGVVDGVLHSAGSQILGQIFGIFNAAVLTLVGIIALYTLFVGTIRTAHEGEVLGKSWSSTMIPVRTVMGLALLVPKASGYSFIQIFIMWVVVQGVGAADTVWKTAVNYLAAGGSLVQMQSAGLQNTDVVTVAGNILKMETCMYSVSNVLNNIGINHPDANVTVTPFVGTLVVMGNNTQVTPPCYPNASNTYPNRCYGVPGASPPPDTGGYINFPGPIGWSQYGQQGYPYTGSCGKIAWQFTGVDDQHPVSSTNLPDMDSNDSRSGAIQLLMVDLEPLAQSLANVLIPLLTNPGPFVPAQASDLNTWISTNDGAQAMLVQYAADYMAIRQPYIQTAANKRAGQQSTDLQNTANNDGWILAGSYYAQLASYSTSNPNAETVNTTTINYGSGQGLGYAGFPPGSFPDLSTDQINALSNNQPHDTALTPNNTYTQGATNVIDNNYILKNISNAALTFGSPTTNKNIIQGSTERAGLESLAPFLTIFPTGTVVAPLLMGMAADITNHVNKFTDPTLDPIKGISDLGFDILSWTENIWILSTVAMFFGGLAVSAASCVNPLPYALEASVAIMVPMLTALIIGMAAAGAAMAYYVPLIPYILFLFTAIGWFISVIEAMVAAPLVALGIAHPEGQHEILGRAEPAIMLLTNVFLRPTLIIIGFITASILVRVALWLFNLGFVRLMQPTGGGIFALAGAIIIYTWIVMEIIERCFALIHEIPARTLRWISGQVESYGEAEAARAVKGGVEAGLGVGKGAMEGGMKGAAGEFEKAGAKSTEKGGKKTTTPVVTPQN